MAHTLIGLKSLLRGLRKLILNEEKINEDLQNNWAVVSEAIQTILRREGYPEPFEAVKALTRKNEKVTRETIADFIEGLDISDTVKAELKSLSPRNYIGK